MIKDKIRMATNPAGDEYWWKGNTYHREDGPAITYSSGTRLWIVNGVAHNEDGPACIYFDGQKEWWIDGIEISEEMFLKQKLLKLLK